MRIIAGKYRGRKISPPQGTDTTRPITDRLKQSLFDRLAAMHMLGGHVLDLFAGTGSLGLEALSRGADHCTFIEQKRPVRALLEQNLAALALSNQATVLPDNALKLGWINRLSHRDIRVAYCDPPYWLMGDPPNVVRVTRLIDAIASVMEPQGLMVLRTEHRIAPPAVSCWPDTAVSHIHGSMALHFYHSS